MSIKLVLVLGYILKVKTVFTVVVDVGYKRNEDVEDKSWRLFFKICTNMEIFEVTLIYVFITQNTLSYSTVLGSTDTKMSDLNPGPKAKRL